MAYYRKPLPHAFTQLIKEKIMLNVSLDKTLGIATLTPDGELTSEDFEAAAKIIDPYIDEYELLNGIIIYTKDFPSWDSFTAMLKHFKFVRDHHNKVTHVALVTDSKLGALGEHLATHFVAAKIKHFAFNDPLHAQDWILHTKHP